MPRDELLSRLSNLLPSQFERVLFHARIPIGYLPGAGAPQVMRAIEVIRYLEPQGRLPQLAAIVHDVAQSDEVRRMALLDLDADKAAAVAQEHGAGKASASGIDARDVGALADAIAGAGAEVLLNTASYRINLEAMRACLIAGCHYLDLGGLYRMTLRQLELSAEFETNGSAALLDSAK